MMSGELPYANLSTNAHVLNEGDQLTKDQIDALAQLEHEFIENRRGTAPWRVIRGRDTSVENVLHAFICQALHDCVCRETKEVN